MKITINQGVLFATLIIIVFSWAKNEGPDQCRTSNARKRICRDLSTRIPVTHKLKNDLSFFKICIVENYCFRGSGDRWTSVPIFKGYWKKRRRERRRRKQRKKRLRWKLDFEMMAKRIELFFIRNNDWQRTMAAVRDHSTEKNEQVAQLRYVVAARYFYVTYILRLLSADFYFDPCAREGHKYIAPTYGACYIPPTQMTCYSDHEIKLLGGRSGTLTGLFNQFFREPLGRDRIVPGFGKSPQKIMGANVVAFQMEFSMPEFFISDYDEAEFKANVMTMQSDIKYQMLEVVVAIYKMRNVNVKYFNDLMSDRMQLRSKPILTMIFQGWTVQLKLFDKKINNFVGSAHHSKDLSFRRRNNIGYELVLGTIENTEIPWWRMLAEDATALLHGSESYMTHGAARHVVGEMEMKFKLKQFKMRDGVTDYWMSMLENWADANQEYNRECVKDNLRIHVCLLKMSKYLRRMFDAMHKARLYLVKSGVAHRLLHVDRHELRSIVTAWEVDLKNKGINEIPNRSSNSRIPKTSDASAHYFSNSRPRRRYVGYSRHHRSRYGSYSRRHRNYVRRPYSIKKAPRMSSSVERFLYSFKCRQPRYIREMRMSRKCMDAIHEEIRKYNRKLFLMKARNWRPPRPPG